MIGRRQEVKKGESEEKREQGEKRKGKKSQGEKGEEKAVGIGKSKGKRKTQRNKEKGS